MALLSWRRLGITLLNVSLLSVCRHSASAGSESGGGQLHMPHDLLSRIQTKHISNSLKIRHVRFLFSLFPPLRFSTLICTSFTFILNLLCAICSPMLSWDTGQTDHFLFAGSWAPSFVFVLSDEIRSRSWGCGQMIDKIKMLTWSTIPFRLDICKLQTGSSSVNIVLHWRAIVNHRHYGLSKGPGGVRKSPLNEQQELLWCPFKFDALSFIFSNISAQFHLLVRTLSIGWLYTFWQSF